MSDVQTRGTRGLALVDILVAASLMVVLGAMSVPLLANARDRLRSEAASRSVLTLARTARFEAARRGATVGLRARTTADGVVLRLHVDGNENGVRLAEVLDGTDPSIGHERRVADDFPGVSIVIRRALPEPEGSATLSAGSDPARLGSADIVSFTPLGTCSGGTIYLEGRDETPYAVRMLGATGRVRLLRFHRFAGRWEAL